MIFRDGMDYIEVYDVPVVKTIEYLSKNDTVGAVYVNIIDWSDEQKITYYRVGQIKQPLFNKILKYIVDKITEINQDSEKIISTIRTMILFNTRPVLEQIIEKYYNRFQVCFPAVDNFANLRLLPSGHNIETMRYDDFLIVQAVIAAKIELNEREQKRRG